MQTEKFDEAFDRIIVETVNSEARTQIHDDLNLFTMGLDSLGLIKLIMRLEDEFGISWPVEQLAEHQKFTVVGQLRRACRDLAAVSDA